MNRQLSLGLEVYKAFKEHNTGNHKPLQYNTEAADAIAKFITESVAANSTSACRDLRSYFNAMPVDTSDDSPFMTVLSIAVYLVNKTQTLLPHLVCHNSILWLLQVCIQFRIKVGLYIGSSLWKECKVQLNWTGCA